MSTMYQNMRANRGIARARGQRLVVAIQSAGKVIGTMYPETFRDHCGIPDNGAMFTRELCDLWNAGQEKLGTPERASMALRDKFGELTPTNGG